MFSQCRTALAVLFCAASVVLVGCNATTHPNQLNAFDGQTYDTLITARAALTTLEADVQTKYPKYLPEFNVSATAFNTAVQAYSVYRTAPVSNQETVTLEIGNLTVSVVALEQAIQQELQVPPATVAAVRDRVEKSKHQITLQTRVTISDILTELQIAAGVAEAVPAAQPYAGLAALVIQATQAAVAQLQQTQGSPINLSNLAPIQTIPVGS